MFSGPFLHEQFGQAVPELTTYRADSLTSGDLLVCL